jgi:hypothetical protein
VSAKKHQGDNHEGPARSAPYGLSRLAPETTLVDVAKEISEADTLIGQATSSKLKLIAAQIRRLQDDAREILDHAKRDLDLHRAACAFSRMVGCTYHLYEKADGRLVWSMLSPTDWGDPPHRFRGSYRLEPDRSWTPLDEFIADETTDELLSGDALVRRLLTPPSRE